MDDAVADRGPASDPLKNPPHDRFIAYYQSL